MILISYTKDNQCWPPCVNKGYPKRLGLRKLLPSYGWP